MIKYCFLLLCCFSFLKIDAQIEQRTSSDVECISGLKIHKFRTHDRGAAQKKDWKVVVGRTIDYKAKGGSDPIWNWWLGSGECITLDTFWKLETQSTFKSKGKDIFISNASMPTNNSDFGETNGSIKVFNGSQESCIDKNDSIAMVEIYYEKDANTNPDGTVPNWYYYWKDAYGPITSPGLPFFTFTNEDSTEVILDTTLNEVTFELIYQDTGVYAVNLPLTPNTQYVYGTTPAGLGWYDHADMRNVYNSSESCIPIGARKVMVGYKNIDFIINIGKICGYQLETYDWNIIDKFLIPATKKKKIGVEAFVGTIIHELEHWKIKERLWSTGYDSADDCDQDGYPDSWESSDTIAMEHGFLVGTDDTYSSAYRINLTANTIVPKDPNSTMPLPAGTTYEEMVCRICAHNKDTSILNSKDWSFDPQKTYQGKQWKK